MVDSFQQVQKIVGDLGEIISQTLGQKREELSKFDENATSKVLSTFDNVRKRITELSNENANFKIHIQEKEPEIQKVESNMKNILIECYQKKYKPIEKLQKERNAIHEEANKLKAEAQQLIGNCLTSEDRQKCLQKGLSPIEKKAQKLLKKISGFSEKRS